MEHPALMILDNHDSHLSIEVLDFAEANGIVMVTIPPHYSHKLGPRCRRWGLAAGYQPRPQLVDRGTTTRYGGQLRYKRVSSPDK